MSRGEAFAQQLHELFNDAIAEGIKQAFSKPQQSVPDNQKTVADEIRQQVRAVLIETVRGSFRQSLQKAMETNCKQIVASGFNLQTENLKQFWDEAKELEEHNMPPPKKNRLHEKPSVNLTQGMEAISNLALRSPIAPKIAIPNFASSHSEKIVTTPLAYDSNKKAWKEPLGLELEDAAEEKFEITPVTYKKINGEFEAVDETNSKVSSEALVKYSDHNTTGSNSQSAPSVDSANPPSRRAAFVRSKGISLQTGMFFGGEEPRIPTTPVNAKGQEIQISTSDDGKSGIIKPDDGYEDDNEEESDGNRVRDPSKIVLKKMQKERLKNGNNLTSTAVKNIIAKKNSNKSGSKDYIISEQGFPAECQTPTSRTKKDLKNAQFEFLSDKKSDSGITSSTEVSVSTTTASGTTKKIPHLKSRNAAISKMQQLKEIYSSTEPLSASPSPVKILERGMECPSPKRGRLQRSVTLGLTNVSQGSLGNVSVKSLQTAFGGMEECQTPHSRELANSKFDFVSKKRDSSLDVVSETLGNT